MELKHDELDGVFTWSQNEMLEVEIVKPDDFLVIKETLSRMGVASKTQKKLWQSCHILHKRGKYYIVSFLELFALDGKPSTITVRDIARRNAIAKLLQDWGLVKIVDKSKLNPLSNLNQIKIVPHKEKSQWEFQTKYTIGKKSR